MNVPIYDEIHVISDLHMGGAPGFQILRETQRLAGFIRWVGQQNPAGRVALILNGDVIDTLAEETGGYVAVDNAVAIVERITQRDPAFTPVWDALAEFVKIQGRSLVIVIGNHDIEVAFPIVQHALIDRLAGGDLAARARIEFSTAGAGYACGVGNARIFCSHGNEVDSWNYIRYEDLSKVARRLNASRSLAPSEWEPNAGTKMVKDVMNEVKRRYAWIDLLKPEAQAAVGVLLVLDPSQINKIPRLIPIVGEKLRGSGEVDQRLSADGFNLPSQPRQASIDQLLGPSLVQGTAQAAKQTAKEMLLAAERDFQNRSQNAALEENQTLGTGQLIWDRITGTPKDEALRRALQDWLAGDATFKTDNRDETFKAMSQSIGSNVDFLITGHTHLERAIDMGGGRFYFNCGTWIRLLRFSDAMLKDKNSFKPVYEILEQGTMDAIDQAVFGGEPFVLDQTSAVSIKTNGGKVIGELAHIGGSGGAITRTVVQQFTRV